VSYGELRARVDAAATALAARAGGGIAFLCCQNDVATVVDYLAALTAGVPVVLLDARLAAAALDALVARYQPAVVLGRAVALPPPTPRPAPHPALALLLSTSGSTGSPRLVRLSRAAVEANARAIAAALALGPGEVAPTSLPLHYSYGLSVVNSHLVVGATLLLTDAGLVSDEFWRACREHGATSLAGVPYSYQMLRRLDLGKLAPPSLRTLTQAGGRLDPALVRHFHGVAAARGGRLFVMYGQTEATARISVLSPDGCPRTPARSARAARRALAVISRQRVIYRGPNVMMGYAEDRADLARGDELGGVLRTGDLGRLDADGRLWITGRVKRIAKVFGLRVNLDELEAWLRGQPDAPVVAAIAGDDKLRVFVEGGAPDALAAIKRALASHTGAHVTGFEVVGVAALPRLASGKIDYAQLEATSAR
jgi:acyl-coenzyme A synthetase/AMP-(fatty) acid ligase